MTQSTSTNSPQPTPATCPACAYSLEGLPPLSFAHPCPECGYPVSQYAPPEQWLRHADPTWLRRIHLGLRLSVFSERYLITLVCALIAGVFLTELLAALAVPGLNPETWFDRFIWIALPVGVITHALSCMLLASPPSPDDLPDAHTRARLPTRWAGALFAPLILIVFALPFAIKNTPPWLLQALDAPVLFVSTPYLIAQPTWLRTLEWRTESWTPTAPRRYRRARRALLWTLGIAIFLKAYWILRFGPGPTDDPSPPLAWAFMLIAFMFSTEQVTKPVRAAVRAELSAPSPKPNAPHAPPPAH